MSFLSKKQARFTQLAILILCLLTGTACSQTNKETTQMTYSNPYNLQFSNEEFTHLKETSIPIHLNPNPKEVYEIEWEIKDSPLKLVQTIHPDNDYIEKKGFITDAYDVFYSNLNKECRYESRSFMHYNSPFTYLLFPIYNVTDNKFKTYYVADAILNEDYRLRNKNNEKIGTCLWENNGTLGIELSTTGEYKEPIISVLLINKENKTYPFSTTYFYEKSYLTREHKEKYFSTGRLMLPIPEDGKPRDAFPDLKDEDLFSITVSIRKVK